MTVQGADHSFEAVDPIEIAARERFVRKIAQGLVADTHAAEDLAQDVWLHSLKAAGVRSPKGFFSRVARNVLTDRLRSESVRRARESSSAREDRVEGPLHVVQRRELAERVLRAVQALPDHYRIPLVLHYYDGLAPTQISEHLDLPFETVRTRLRRGLDRIAVRLKREFRDDGTPLESALFAFLGVRVQSPPRTLLNARPLQGAVAAVVAAAAGVGVVQLLGWGRPDSPGIEHTSSAWTAPGPAPGSTLPTSVAATQRVPLSTPEARPVLGQRNLSGTVRDEFGRTVAGALVRAEWSAGVEASGGSIRTFRDEPHGFRGSEDSAETRTDSGGHYTLSGLPGRFRARAEGERGHATERVLVAEGLPEGDHGAVDFTLIPMRSMSGRVLDAHGRAVPQAEVLVQVAQVAGTGPGVSQPALARQWLRPQDVCDENGIFELEQVSADRSLRLSARRPGQSLYEGRVDLPPGDADVHELILRLPPGVPLLVTVQDDRGGSISGAQVTFIRDPTGGAYEGVDLQTVLKHKRTTDGDGRTRFEHLPPNEPYALSVTAPGRAPAFALSPSLPPEGGTHTIRLPAATLCVGRVVDRNGPVEGAEIQLRPVLAGLEGRAGVLWRSMLWWRYLGRWLACVQSNAQGSFQFEASAGLPYELEIQDRAGGRAALITVDRLQESATYVLDAAGRVLTASVRGARSGKLLPQAAVSLVSISLNMSVRARLTNDGRYSARVPAGDWMIVIEHEGYASQAHPLRAADDSVAVELQVAHRMSLRLPAFEDHGGSDHEIAFEVLCAGERTVPLQITRLRRRCRIPVPQGRTVELAGIPAGPVTVRLGRGTTRVDYPIESYVEGRVIDLEQQSFKPSTPGATGLAVDYSMDSKGSVLFLRSSP